jgi:hypothetical protein
VLLQGLWVAAPPGLCATAAPAVPSTGDTPPVTADDDEGGLETAYVAPTTRDRIGRIMAPVFINGSGPYKFVIDTGASRSVVAPHVAVALGLHTSQDKLLELRGVTGSEVVPAVFVNELRAGELSLSRQTLPVVTPSVFADADGILGVDRFASMCLSASFVQRTVAILKNGCPHVEPVGACQGQFRFGGLLVVKARMHGPSRVQAIIDSGAERSLGNLALLRALKLQQKAEDPSTATTSSVPRHIARTAVC